MVFFAGCCSLNKLPDIFGWVNNATNVRHIFDGCDSLKIYPDLCKWDPKKDNNKLNMIIKDINNLLPKNKIL